MKDVAIVIGRFQPPTVGHLKIFKKIQQKFNFPVVICLVKGKKTSEDKEKNPFPAELQQQMLKDLGYESVIVPSAFIGVILDNLIKNEMFPQVLACGEDRKKDYERMVQIDKYYPENMDKRTKVISFPRDDDNISATKIREAIKDNDSGYLDQAFPKQLHKYIPKLRKFILEKLKYGKFYQILVE